MRRVVVLTLATLLLVTSCVKFKQNTVGVSPQGEKLAASENLYYRFNITDTTVPYKIFFSARFSNKFILNNLPLGILYISPQGKRYSDTIRLYLNETDPHTEFVKNGNWRDYRWLYRDGAMFPEKGIWLVSVKNIHIKEMYGIRELALSLKQKR